MSNRMFEPGDPGLPKTGLLVGRGGGFTLRYFDFTADTNGEISFLNYQTVTGRIPNDLLSILIATTEPGDTREMMGELDDIGFWSIKPVPINNEMTRYLVMIDEKKGMHFLVWGADDQPFPKEFHDVYESIRDRMIGHFISIIK